MRLPAVASAVALVLLLAGCSSPPGPASSTSADAAATAPTQASQAIAFSGQDWPFLCPPAGGVCVVSGTPTGAQEFAQELPAGTVPSALVLDVAWSGTEDPVEFVVEAVCAADEEGDDGCRSDVVLAEASGPLPLRLEATELDLPAGARLVYRVAWQPLVPGMVGGTGQSYAGSGTVDVVAVPAAGTSASASGPA